ncbi:beta-1,4-galactosyltransferase 1 [Triplophysa dalaica]|uniref:beta-1,4-galactosyltransferase 1 n=1 Tax=Triplophysa dalaica TaxID=1582913 RepID=UPI0024DF607E|nr:beta-1,4-galactosyltransferase 1 [Triplophysa dalaica]
MLESVWHVGFLSKACAAATFICGLYITITIFLTSDSETNEYLNYHHKHLFLDLNNSLTLNFTKGITALDLLQYYSDETADKSELIFTHKALEPCPQTSPLLVGPMQVEFSQPMTLDQVRTENPQLDLGGRYAPSNCVAVQKVAIIIPFRNREEHLKYWLHYLHPILQRQQIDYGIYIIQQDGQSTFNRAKLLNVGYAEAVKEYDWNCFVFSDVDIVPMDDRNTYMCSSQPRHLSVSMDKFGFRLPYLDYFGGVSAMSKHQFLKINGFPNEYWGWGGEDDDIFNRLKLRGMKITRPSGDIGKCRMIRHKRDQKNEPNPQRFNRITKTKTTINKDGINSLKYKVTLIEKEMLYTKITVDIR